MPDEITVKPKSESTPATAAPEHQTVSLGRTQLVNLGLTWILGRTAAYYLVVVSVAFVVSTLVSFYLQKFFTFRDADLSDFAFLAGII